MRGNWDGFGRRQRLLGIEVGRDGKLKKIQGKRAVGLEEVG